MDERDIKLRGFSKRLLNCKKFLVCFTLDSEYVESNIYAPLEKDIEEAFYLAFPTGKLEKITGDLFYE